MRTPLAVSVALVAVSASAQVPFEKAVGDLSSADPAVRLRTVRMLKEAAYAESAVPIAKLLTDPQTEVRLEAIAAELNIFLADKVVTRRRVGLVLEVRNAVLAEPIFSTGPLAIGAAPVPEEVLTGLRAAMPGKNRRAALEALYAFGVLAVEPAGAARAELLRASGPELIAFLGSPDPGARDAALRVLGRVFTHRSSDGPIDPGVGDAVIAALNDSDRIVKLAAMDALGSMRYERATQALTELFNYYARGEFADGAVNAIARIAHPSSEPLFVAGLTSNSTAVRIAAIEGLGRLRAADELTAIHAAANTDRADTVALAAAFASAMIANTPADTIREALIRPRLRDQAWAYFSELASGRAPLVARFLGDPDARIRADAVDAIGLGGDPAAIPSIEPLLKDRDAQVVRSAERALATLRRSGVRATS